MLALFGFFNFYLKGDLHMSDMWFKNETQQDIYLKKVLDYVIKNLPIILDSIVNIFVRT